MPPVNSVNLDNLKNMQKAVNEFCKTIGDYKLGLLDSNEIQTESDLHKKMGDLVEIINVFYQKIMHTELHSYMSFYIHTRDLPRLSHIPPPINDTPPIIYGIDSPPDPSHVPSNDDDDEITEDDLYGSSASTHEPAELDDIAEFAALRARFEAVTCRYRRTPSKTQNKKTQNKKTQNKKTQNKKTQNKKTQNKKTQNKKTFKKKKQKISRWEHI